MIYIYHIKINISNGKWYRAFRFSILLPDHIGLSAIQFYNELAKIARTNKATEQVSGSTIPLRAICVYIYIPDFQKLQEL